MSASHNVRIEEKNPGAMGHHKYHYNGDKRWVMHCKRGWKKGKRRGIRRVSKKVIKEQLKEEI